MLPDERPQPLPLASHDETDVAFKARRFQSGVRHGIGSIDPEPFLFQKVDGLREVHDPGDRDVGGGAGRGLDHGGCHGGGAVPGDDHPSGAEAVSRPDQGAQILRVFDPVEQEDQAARKGGMAVGGDGLEVCIGIFPAEAEDALVG